MGRPQLKERKKKQKRKKTKKPDGKVENATRWLDDRAHQQAFPTFPQARLRRQKHLLPIKKVSTFNQGWTLVYLVTWSVVSGQFEIEGVGYN